ncbi:protein cornichon [Anaeramoeba ignava]|uniref:Protein cornichon n=1 Tax=Anaeramoeba ignava TaxID=1746090 RepID=A0A9Q0R4W0_ANAIG|nr:protein cornichon [Anaeramoeba ignava]
MSFLDLCSSTETIFWVINLIINLTQFILLLKPLLDLTDYRPEFQDPIKLCDNLNKWIIPEYFFQALSTILSLFSGKILLFLISISVTIFNGYQYYYFKYQYNPAELYRTQFKHRKEGLIKLLIALICLVYVVLKSSFCFFSFLIY